MQQILLYKREYDESTEEYTHPKLIFELLAQMFLQGKLKENIQTYVHIFQFHPTHQLILHIISNHIHTQRYIASTSY